MKFVTWTHIWMSNSSMFILQKSTFFTQFMTSLGDRVKGRQIHNSTTEWTRYVKFVTWTHVWTTNSMLMFIFQKNNVYDSIHDVIGRR